MNRFQCCMSPSMVKAHLWDTSKERMLTLCEKTSVVTNFKGTLSRVVLCKKCAEIACRELGIETKHIPELSVSVYPLTAEMIGVYAIREL